MKSFFSAILAVMLCSCLAFSQSPNFDVRFNIQEINCEQSFLLVDLEVKATDGTADFNIAHQNYRFTFNDNALANPVIEQELVLSGFVQTSNPTTFSFFGGHTLTGSISNLVSYNVFLAGGSGYPVTTTDWTGVGRVRFDIIDISECFDLTFNTMSPLSFPNTSIIGKDNGFLYQLQEGNYTNDNTCPDTNCTPPLAIAQYDMQFGQTSVDCQNMKFYVDLEISASAMTAGFNAAFMNLRFTYNSGALDNPVIDQEYNFSGFFDNNGDFSFYNPHTLTGSMGNLVSYNVALGGGNGQPVGDAWVPVGRVAFDIININQCGDLRWNDLNDFPSTIVIEKTVDGQLLQAQEGSFNIADACLFEYCPAGLVYGGGVYDVVLKPVPVYTNLGVEFSTDNGGTIQIGVVSSNGRVVLQKTITSLTGINEVSLNLANQPAGVYSIMIMSGKSVYSKQFVKLDAFEAATLR